MFFVTLIYLMNIRGQCLDRIAESLNHLERPSFSVSQKSVRDRLKILERDFKKKERSEKNASGISPEKTEIDQIRKLLGTEGRSREGVREGLRGISGEGGKGQGYSRRHEKQGNGTSIRNKEKSWV